MRIGKVLEVVALFTHKIDTETIEKIDDLEKGDVHTNNVKHYAEPKPPLPPDRNRSIIHQS